MSNQAWECPRCKRINAPFNAMCICKPSEQEQSFYEDMKNGAKGQAPFIPMPLPAGLPYGYTRNDACMVCGKYHGKNIQCVSLEAQ